MNKAYVSSPIFHELLRQPASRNAMAVSYRKGVIGTIIPNLIMTPLMMVYGVVPYLPAGDDDDAFGLGAAATRPMVWAMIVSFILNAFIIWPFSQPFTQMAPVEMAKFTTTMIENYMGKVRATMLASLDAADEEPTRAMFAQLAKDQAKVERWAHSQNDGLSSWNGLMLSMMTAWTFLPIVLMGLYAGTSEFGAGGFAMLSFMTLMFFFGFTQTITAVTLVSRTFVKGKIRVLNDARLVPVIERSFRYRREFIEWLARPDVAEHRVVHIPVACSH